LLLGFSPGRQAAAQLQVQTASAAASAPPSAELFARTPLMSHVQPSPSGRRLAMILPQADGKQVLAVQDLPARAPPKGVAAFRDGDVEWFQWVNDDRLVLGVSVRSAEAFEGEGGVFAIDHDGDNSRQLVAWRPSVEDSGSHIKTRVLPYSWYLVQVIQDGSDDVVMGKVIGDATHQRHGTHLARLNTRTGQLTEPYDGVPSGTDDWVFDAQGEIRFASSDRDGRSRLYQRQGDSANWELIDDRQRFDAKTLTPEFLEGKDKLIVSTQVGGDTDGFFSYDLTKRAIDPEPLLQAARFDVASLQVDAPSQRVVGVGLDADRPMSVWFTERLDQAQRAVDKALPPGRFNTLLCGQCESTAFYVVLSQSDRQPGEYYLYDDKNRKLTPLGASRPWIAESSQGRRSFRWFQARDGLPLSAVVTDPPGHEAKEALPAVLLVHGGPWVHGADLRWSADAQFLATRGYRVIEPEFRGSAGYGARHFTAGLKQWGRAMEDDLADAVHWAAAQGLIDPHRVCIYGASYGGYAALMGPITYPGMFRCAASYAGVTDIRLMFTSYEGDWSEQSRRYALRDLIGDPDKDAAMLRQASPIERVSEIKVPVLLVQGALDRRVPREQADRFESAARSAGVPIERVTYPDELHGWVHQEDEADFLNRLAGFFAKSLSP
jgi:dienelactone hydrolase